MLDPLWQPRCTRPDSLARPVRLDPLGLTGPTRGQARGRAWRRSSHGWFVEAGASADLVDQRILEQGVRIGVSGAVTDWAGLRWRGAAYFDGTAPGRPQLPVPLLRMAGGDQVRAGGAVIGRSQLAPTERELVDGIWCATVQRSLFDRVRQQSSLREAVVDLDMTFAAELISRDLFAEYVGHRPAWTGVPLVRKALPLASEHSASPQEVRMRLVWVLDLDLPTPLVNQPLFDLREELLAIPDLFDPVAGVVGEYQGAIHKDPDRHRADVARFEVLRDHGLECFEVVGGDLRDRDLVARRMSAARSRARWLEPEHRRWTIEHPPWWRRTPPLTQRLLAQGPADALTHR